jgi:hypothetical protein
MKGFLGLSLVVWCGLTSILAVPQTATDTAKTDASADESKATIEGLVRDIACPIQNLEATATHLSMKCLLACARKGSPLVILTKDGDLYLPISDKMPDEDQRQKLMPFLGKYVRASGAVYERKGTHAIAINKIEELKDMHLNIEDQ